MFTIGTTVLPRNASTGVHVLRKYRQEAGIALSVFAEQCGASAATISRIERGIQWPSRKLTRRLLAATNHTVAFADFLAFRRAA
jgi:transcriptional regulator with XRE-family HTH domain